MCFIVTTTTGTSHIRVQITNCFDRSCSNRDHILICLAVICGWLSKGSDAFDNIQEAVDSYQIDFEIDADFEPNSACRDVIVPIWTEWLAGYSNVVEARLAGDS